MKKYGIEDIKSSMEKEGYVLLSKEYSSIKKLEFVCPNGHKGSMLSCNWNGGKRCRICSFKKMGMRSRMGFDKIKIAFESEGYKLLVGDKVEYENNEQKLKFICPNGHQHQISWTKWQQGQRCSYCNGKIRLNIDFVRKELKKEGYILLSDRYLNSRTKFRYVCHDGHAHQTTWGHWQQGQRCPTCQSLNRFGSGHWNWQGGIACEPYCDVWLDKDFKKSIKQRDGYKCMNPDCWKTAKRLAIHHIDYVKKNCDPKNLITLCTSCNSRANKDIEWHRAWYQTIMAKRYEYKYLRVGA